MLNILRTLSLVLLLAAPWAARAELLPDVLAKQITNEVIRIVKIDRDLQNGNSQKIYDLVDVKVLPHFDFEHMAKLAVARNWSKATPEQQSRLVSEFRALLVRTYAASISSIVDYQVEFKPLRMNPGETDVMVNTVVSKSGSPPIPIDYRVEKGDKGWKVYDVMVDNVSLVTVYRNSFNSEVRKGGIDGLIETLARRNQKVAAQNSK